MGPQGGTPERLRRKLRRSRRFDHGEPISRIDTRPMVFVFSIIPLLLLFAAQATPHAVVVELWNGKSAHPLIPRSAERTPQNADVINRLTLDVNYAILWNGEAVNSAELRTLLHDVQTQSPQSVVEFEPDGNASSELAARVLQLLVSSGAQFQITGMENYCEFSSVWPPYDRSTRVLSMTHSVFPVEPFVATGKPCDPIPAVHSPGQ